MKQSKQLMVLIAILSCAALVLIGFAVHDMLGQNGGIGSWGDADAQALPAGEAYLLGTLYEEGKFLTSDSHLAVTSQGYLTNPGGETTYQLTLGAIDFAQTGDKVILRAVASENSGGTIRLYAGKDAKPFLEAPLPETASAFSAYDREFIYDISQAKLKGKRMIRVELRFEGPAAPAFELRSLEFQAATIPTLYFRLDESQCTIAAMNKNKENFCSGSLFISIPEGYQGEYTDNLREGEYPLEEIHGRGNSTWDCDKKPYTMKLGSKEDLFGMGAAKKWVLLANYYDKSLMRNKLAYDLAADMGMPFASKSVFVDVVMNNQYTGSYLLTEKVETKTNRVEIFDLEDYPTATDLSVINGGYLLEMKPDNRVTAQGNDDVYFWANHTWSKVMVVESPSLKENENPAQLAYIEDYYCRFEEALYSDDFTNSQGERYTDLVDVDSFVDFYLVHEIFKNNDALYASTFFYKDVNAKMCIGPVWDLDLSAGTYACNNTQFPEGFFLNREYLFNRLFEDPEFVEKVIQRYYEVRPYAVNMICPEGDETLSDIREYAQLLDISQKMNFDKWGMGNRGWAAVLGQGSYEAEVEYLESWLEKRIAWLDANIESLR